MYKMDSTLNNLQWLMCHKTKPNQTNNQPINKGGLLLITCRKKIGWLFVRVFRHINLCWLFKAKTIFIQISFISNNSV